jgi:micrococcal nuclease
VESLRLIGINTPERGECFADEAGEALAALTPAEGQISATIDVSDRDANGRLLRYLWIGDLSVNEELVRRGAAISRRYPPDVALAERFEVAQAEARETRRGLWAPDACGPAADAYVRTVDVVFDAPGDDNFNLNEEYVIILNDGVNPVDLSGWSVKDESASHRYRFPEGFVLTPGETLTLRTGCGDDFGTELFWCTVGSAVWNNDGDTVFIMDPNGNTHDSHTYSSPSSAAAPEPPASTPAAGAAPIAGGCDPSYPDVCIPSPPPDLDCGDIPHRRFRVLPPDPHRFDGNDDDGLGCESG